MKSWSGRGDLNSRPPAPKAVTRNLSCWSVWLCSASWYTVFDLICRHLDPSWTHLVTPYRGASTVGVPERISQLRLHSTKWYAHSRRSQLDCDMSEAKQNLSRPIRAKIERCAAPCAMFLCALLLLLLFGFTPSAWAQASDTGSVAATSIGSGLQFAIADFDGDHRPDTTYVQAGQDPNNDSYYVNFRLSSKGRSCFRLFAPSGGISVEARDVNGDHAVDLVVTTAWFGQPVAVLLNDGHGTFTAAKPGAFPSAFRRAENKSFSTNRHLVSPTGVLTQSRLSMCAEASLSHRPLETRFHSHSSRAIFLPSYLLSNRGRAPPIRS